MEKFGIFNILSSLLGADKAPTDKNSPENVGDTASSSKSDNAPSAEKRATFAPLQNSMLKTMRNHDEFVKRVQEKNKKRF